MDVSLSCRCAFVASMLLTVGCMNPGYQTLFPPGFSSTALRNKRHQSELDDVEFAQLLGQPLPKSSLTDPATAQMAKRSRNSGSHWNKGYEYLAKEQQKQAPATSPQPSATANLRERPTFTGWRDQSADTRTQ